MNSYDGVALLLLPDGTPVEISVHAGLRGRQWRGTVSLDGSSRRLELGDVCRLSATPLGEHRVIITDPRGRGRYDFVALVQPDPWERLD